MNHSCHNAGFSLIEIMIAILILGVALTGLTGAITTALTSNKESELQTSGTLIAAGQIETLRADKNIIDGETDGDCGPDLPLYRWSQTVSPGGVDGLHEVKVAVQNSKTGASICELSTMLFDPDYSGQDGDDSMGAKEKPRAKRGKARGAE